jgi:SAM-dependent methyltransferase
MSTGTRDERAEAGTATVCPLCGGRLSDHDAITTGDRLLGVPGEFTVLECAACRSGVTTPFVAETELATLYEGEYGPHDEWSPNLLIRAIIKPAKAIYAWHALRSQPFSWLEEHDGKLLDVGCGRGEQGQMLKARGWQVEAVEPDPDACAFVAARGVKAHQGSLTTVDLEDESFDVVLFHHSLEHVADPNADLARAFALLKPGGRVLIAMPNYGCWQRKTFGGDWFNLELPRHRIHFTDASLRTAVERAGFDSIESSFGTTLGCLPCSLQYRWWGRLVVRGNLAERVYMAACALLQPPTALLNRLRGGGDVLNLTARKPAGPRG